MPEEKKTEGTTHTSRRKPSPPVGYYTFAHYPCSATAQTDSDYAPTGSTPGQQHLTPAVPPGWAATWDAPNNRWTYLEQSTGRTQIEHPDPANYGGQSMPPGGPVLDKDGKPKKDKNGLLIGAAGGLATGAFGAKLMGLAKKKAGSLSFFIHSDCYPCGDGEIGLCRLTCCTAMYGWSFEQWSRQPRSR